MKKILLTFGGTRFSEGPFQFVRQLNELQPVLLVGVFLPEVIYPGIYAVETGMPATYSPLLIDENEEEIVQKNIDRLTALCHQNNIDCRIHKDYSDLALPELKKETRFADLLVICSEKFYDTFGLNDPNPSMSTALHTSECPVIVVPEYFNFPQQNILAYDGSESSVFAIKQFAYLFPELCGHETLLVYAKEEVDTGLPEEAYIKEFAAQHFTNLTLQKLHIQPKKFFNDWISEKQNAILVGGSFGRSLVSELFRESFVAKIIAEHKLPVFIAHR